MNKIREAIFLSFQGSIDKKEVVYNHEYVICVKIYVGDCNYTVF